MKIPSEESRYVIQTNFMGETSIVQIGDENEDGVIAEPLKMLKNGPFESSEVSSEVESQMSAYESKLDQQKGSK